MSERRKSSQIEYFQLETKKQNLVTIKSLAISGLPLRNKFLAEKRCKLS